MVLQSIIRIQLKLSGRRRFEQVSELLETYRRNNYAKINCDDSLHKLNNNGANSKVSKSRELACNSQGSGSKGKPRAHQ